MKEKASGTYYKWVILFIIWIGMFSPNYTQYQLSPIAGDLMTAMGLSAAQFSSVFSAPMIPGLLLALITGSLFDRFGARKLCSIYMVIAAVSTCLRVFSHNYMALFWSVFFSCLSATVLNTNGVKIIGTWFSPNQVPKVMAVFLASSTLATTIAMGTTAFFPNVQTAFAAAAALAIIAALLMILLMRDRTIETDPEAVQVPPPSVKESLKVVATSKGCWLIALAYMFAYGSSLTLSQFLPSALSSKGLDPVSAGAVGSLASFGTLAGCFVPFFIGRLKNLKPLMFLCGAIAALGAAFAWLLPAGILQNTVFFCVGIASGAGMPLLMIWPLKLKEIGLTYAGTAGGLLAMVGLFGAIVLPSYIIVPMAGNNYHLLFLMSGLCMALYVALAMLLPNTAEKG